jgi:hypothetical protein
VIRQKALLVLSPARRSRGLNTTPARLPSGAQ